MDSLNKSTLHYYNHEKANSYNFDTLNIKEDTKDYLSMNCIITSKTNSGKSVLLRNLCYDLRDRYSEVFVFSLTAHLQPDLFNFVPEDNIINRWDEALLNDIFKAQEKITLTELNKGTDKDKIPRILIIYDDLISEPEVKKSKVLKKLFVLGRHAAVSQIFLTQSFTAVDPVLRKNSALAIAFYLDNIVDREAFVKSYLSTDNVKQGMLVFEKITKEPYQAICVLNCITSQNPEDVIRKFTAKLNVPKFMIKRGIKSMVRKQVSTPVSEALFIKTVD